ncbi:hypothetical protein MSL71_40880 [Desulfoluna butyratoxydans]|uniref:Uncharacterized protein n=1 Tax=Desulfoluna butyratoxydans TaxID=231438 RepID=A0A4U8YRR1_9BACT|nr:hypothetical protein MSL71_40880 [Desulfoluna butyratoxydans]
MAHLNYSRPESSLLRQGRRTMAHPEGSPHHLQGSVAAPCRAAATLFRDAGPLYRGSCPMPETAGKCLAQGVFRAFNGHFQGKGTHRCGCVRPPPRSVQPSCNTRPPAARPPFTIVPENASVPFGAAFNGVPFTPRALCLTPISSFLFAILNFSPKCSLSNMKPNETFHNENVPPLRPNLNTGHPLVIRFSQ